LVLRGIDPTEHYVHVRCPQDAQESVYLITPRAGQNVQIRHGAIIQGTGAGASTPGAAGMAEAATDPAEAKIKLRELVPQAVQLRAQARFDEAVQLLRQAARMDPGNSDLHRELGITFLLAKDWKRARVEMLEAIRHDPGDADAHNGLGYSLEKLGEIEPALKEYRTATQLDPDDPSYRQHYLEALVKEAGERQQKGKKKSRI
jgi:Flp pilus assembly protein TadD